MEWSALYPRSRQPDLSGIGSYINTPLWDELRRHMEQDWGLSACVGFSGCSMAAGWNVKYRKSGRFLFTCYPGHGFFTALVVVSERQDPEVQLLRQTWSPYTQKLFDETGCYRDGRWLMVEVTSPEILEDLKTLIRLRAQK